MTAPPDMAGWAIAYCGLGFPASRCGGYVRTGLAAGAAAARPARRVHHPAKHPVGRFAPNGFKDATTDAAQVADWWQQDRSMNIGLATGSVVDVLDVDHDDYAEGVADLPDCTTAGGPVVVTGRGRIHLYFAATGIGRKIKFSEHCDWLGVGGYTIAPPSRHVCGGHYEWFGDTGPWTPLTKPPRRLLDLLDPPRMAIPDRPLSALATRNGPREERSPRGWSPVGLFGKMATAIEGERNSILHWCAARIGRTSPPGRSTRTRRSPRSTSSPVSPTGPGSDGGRSTPRSPPGTARDRRTSRPRPSTTAGPRRCPTATTATTDVDDELASTWAAVDLDLPLAGADIAPATTARPHRRGRPALSGPGALVPGRIRVAQVVGRPARRRQRPGRRWERALHRLRGRRPRHRRPPPISRRPHRRARRPRPDSATSVPTNRSTTSKGTASRHMAELKRHLEHTWALAVIDGVTEAMTTEALSISRQHRHRHLAAPPPRSGSPPTVPPSSASTTSPRTPRPAGSPSAANTSSPASPAPPTSSPSPNGYAVPSPTRPPDASWSPSRKTGPAGCVPAPKATRTGLPCSRSPPTPTAA